MQDFTGLFPTQTIFWWLFVFCDIYLERKISSVLKLFKSVFPFRPLIWYRAVHGLSSNAKELRTKQGISELQRGAVWGQANPLGPGAYTDSGSFACTVCLQTAPYSICISSSMGESCHFTSEFLVLGSYKQNNVSLLTLFEMHEKKWSVGNGTKIAELTSCVL